MIKKLKSLVCGWRFWVILIAVIAGTVLFGSVVAQWGGIFFGWISTFFGWISKAFKWLAKILNFFGWNGML